MGEGDDAYARIGEALASIGTRQLTSESKMSVTRNTEHASTVEPPANGRASEPLSLDKSDKIEAAIPSELITSCVSAMLMIQVTFNISQELFKLYISENSFILLINVWFGRYFLTSCAEYIFLCHMQKCAELQHPPADVAQIIDSAATSFHSGCPQNLPILREIQTYMGRIKTQLLALVPT